MLKQGYKTAYMSQIIPLNTHSYMHKYCDFVYVGSHLEILQKAYIWFMWKYKIWVRPSPIHIQGRQSPGRRLLAPNGTRESPIGTPPGLELLSSCYRFAQVFLLNHLPHPPTQQTKASPYTFISGHAERGPISSEKQKPEGHLVLPWSHLRRYLPNVFAICSRVPDPPAVPNCPLPIRNGSSQGIFFRIYLLLFPWEFHYAWVTGLWCCFCLTFCIR